MQKKRQPTSTNQAVIFTLLNCAIKLNRITVSGTQPSNKSYAMTSDFYKPALRQQGSDQHTVVILRE